MSRNIPKITISAFLSTALLLSGCNMAQLEKNAAPVLKETKNEAKKAGAEFFDDNETIIGVDADANNKPSFAMWKPKNDAFPIKNVVNLTVNDNATLDTLRLLSSSSGISLIVKGSFSNNSATYGSSALENYSGSLQDTIEIMSKTFGFFYTYKNKTLTVYPNQRFVFELPPNVYTDVMAGFSNTIESLGAFDIQLDRDNKTIAFNADLNAYEKIVEYFQNVEKNRNLLIYDVSIYQVDFTDQDSLGIQWNQLNTNASGTNPSSGTIDGNIASPFGSALLGVSSVGVSIVSSKLSGTLLLNFLRSQGKVRSISQPKIMFLSNSKGSFRQGRNTTYVSQTGTNYSTSVNTVTMTTSTIQTGVELTIYGEENAGTIYSHISLTIADLIKMGSISSNGTSVQLPDVENKDIKNEVRCRAGDTIVLGGISIHSFQNDKSSLVDAVPIYSGDSITIGEVVIVMKPRVVKFRPSIIPQNKIEGFTTEAKIQNAADKIKNYAAQKKGQSNVDE